MTNDIIKLRQETGAGIMDCQKALKEAGNDFDKAVSIIREQGKLIAKKKSEKNTGAGFLKSYIHNERVGVLLELRCETDFAAKSDSFRELADNLAMQIIAMNPETIDDLLKEPYIKDENIEIDNLIKETIAKVGENIKIERFCRYEL